MSTRKPTSSLATIIGNAQKNAAQRGCHTLLPDYLVEAILQAGVVGRTLRTFDVNPQELLAALRTAMPADALQPANPATVKLDDPLYLAFMDAAHRNADECNAEHLTSACVFAAASTLMAGAVYETFKEFGIDGDMLMSFVHPPVSAAT